MNRTDGYHYKARRTGGDIFVPTRSWAEWNAVTAVAPGLSLEIKPATYNYHSWYPEPGIMIDGHCDERIAIYCGDETFGSWNNGAGVDNYWCNNYPTYSSYGYPHYYRYC